MKRGLEGSRIEHYDSRGRNIREWRLKKLFKGTAFPRDIWDSLWMTLKTKPLCVILDLHCGEKTTLRCGLMGLRFGRHPFIGNIKHVRYIEPFWRTTPTLTIEAIIGLVSLHRAMEVETQKAFICPHECVQWKGNNKTEPEWIWSEMFRSDPLLAWRNAICTVFLPSGRYHVTVRKRE